MAGRFPEHRERAMEAMEEEAVALRALIVSAIRPETNHRSVVLGPSWEAAGVPSVAPETHVAGRTTAERALGTNK